MSENPIDQANKAFTTGDYGKALELWTAALTSVGAEHHYALHTNRGAALERLGKVEEAIGAYDEALRSKPDHVEALHNRGVAFKALKQYPESLASFDGALSFKPDFYPSLRGRTDMLTILERFDEAIEAATAAAAAKPADPSPFADRAFAHLKVKKLEEALTDYAKARELGDNSIETRRLQAIALSQRAVELDKAGDLETAEKYYSQAIDFEGTESRLFNRAFLYMRTARTDLAIEGYRAVAGMSTTNFQARAALGTLLLQREAFKEAIPVLQEAQALNAAAADIIFNLGFAYLREERMDEAEAQFKRALEVDPAMENAKSGLAAVQVAKGGGVKYRVEAVGEAVEVGAAGGEPATSSSSTTGPSSSSASSAAPSKPVVPKPASAAAAAAPSSGGKGGGGAPSAQVRALAASIAAPAVSSMHVGGTAAAAGAGGAGVGAAEDPKFTQDADGVDGETHPYEKLKAPGPFPPSVDAGHREAYLSRDEFKRVLGMAKPAFYAAPKWKRVDLRKKAGLF